MEQHRGEEQVTSVKGLAKCAVFSRKEYETWRVLVDTWLDLEGGKKKYPGLEMRWAVESKVLEIIDMFR